MVPTSRRALRRRKFPKADLGPMFYLASALPSLAFLVLLFRLWFIQVASSAEFEARAASLRSSILPLSPPRGLIVDRHGALMAGVRSVPVVTAIPASVAEDPAILSTISAMAGSDRETLAQRIEENMWRRFLPAPILVGLDSKRATQVAEAASVTPGLGVELRPARYYPDSVSFAHVLGYVWTPSAEDVRRLEGVGVQAGEYVGKTGVEAVYEEHLMGVAGRERVEVDGRGRPTRMLSRENPLPGEKLTLTIDSTLQKRAFELLQGTLGSIVVLDPRNGEVLCLASSPSYDVSLFLGGISKADYTTISKDPNKPLLNRAIQGFYSPGSTFKIVTALAASSIGEFDVNRTSHCPGYYQVGNRRLKCLGTHGDISFDEAFAKSCNAYFAELGIRAGRKALTDTCLTVGLGNRTMIDLFGEGRGVVPTEEWIRSARKPADSNRLPWYLGDTANLSIGQGDLTASPLQMANLAALVASRGRAFKPHLLKSRQLTGGDLESVTPEPRWHFSASEKVWDALHHALVGVIDRGTGRSAQIPGVRWAGKTGSTEHRRADLTHSWFVGYAPADSPRAAVAVLIERAGHGSEVAAPIAARIMGELLALQSRAARSEASLSAASSAQPTPASSPTFR